MKVIVKERFRDKVTGQIYNVGDKITLSKSRFNEIQKKGDYVEAAAVVKPKEEK